ncbi:MAG: very short patch repair endonuclease [Rhodospirillales bacterium]|nr:very short patch repair endonuclease [Rhodospirillales bacterium]
MDTLTPEQRSERMSRIRGKGSKIELLVRRLAHALGYRYRLHRKELPGCPDLVFPGRRKVVFVHGCFWHRHEGCKLARMPKSKVDFWEKKLEANRQRDLRDQDALSRLGWDILVLWECELKNRDRLSATLVEFLD